MAVTVISSTESVNAGGVVNSPSGVFGDIIAAFCYQTAGTVPTGFTQRITFTGGAGENVRMFTKLRTASEPATYSFGSVGFPIVQCIDIRNAFEVPVLLQNLGAGGGPSSVITGLSINSLKPGLLLLYAEQAASTALSTPAGMTPVRTSSNIVVTWSQTVDYTGATGNRSSTSTLGANGWGTLMAAFRELDDPGLFPGAFP